MISKTTQCIKKQTMKSIKTSLLIKTALCFMGCILLLSSPSQGCFIVGDLDGNCRIDIDDLLLMASQWMDPLSCGSETGLILHWKLNETSGMTATDSSGLGYDGYAANIGWNPVGGILGGSAVLDGNSSHIWIGQDPEADYPTIKGSNPRTSAAWIKANQPYGPIMSWGDLDIDGGAWVIWIPIPCDGIWIDIIPVTWLLTGNGFCSGRRKAACFQDAGRRPLRLRGIRYAPASGLFSGRRKRACSQATGQVWC